MTDTPTGLAYESSLEVILDSTYGGAKTRMTGGSSHQTDPAANKWHRHFLSLAYSHSLLSKDPSTKVGAVLVGPDREIISAGFNGLPRKVEDRLDRLGDRDTRLDLTVHAEMNAVLAAARLGHPVRGATAYLIATSADGRIWGGPPCIRCTVEMIQAGISKVISLPKDTAPERWQDSLQKSVDVMQEAGVEYQEIGLW